MKDHLKAFKIRNRNKLKEFVKMIRLKKLQRKINNQKSQLKYQNMRPRREFIQIKRKVQIYQQIKKLINLRPKTQKILQNNSNVYKSSN